MRRDFFGPMMLVLYGAAIATAAGFANLGWRYYSLPLVERPHHVLHTLLKPGGLFGHGLGIFGSCMLLLLFLYSARKRRLWGLRFGRMSHWLHVHIFFGLIGPMLITLHTAMKFSGIVSISYFSMLAVMLSGIFGRYIYMQIPRDAGGDALTREQIEAKDQQMTKVLREQLHISPQVMYHIQQISAARLAPNRKGLAALASIVANDVRRPFMFRRLHRMLLAERQRIPARVLSQIMKITKQKSLLLRRRVFLDSINSIFHYWHVIHKPFAYVMIVIMFLHILVAIIFGYRWIF